MAGQTGAAGPEVRHIRGGSYQLFAPNGWEGGTVVGLAPGYTERDAATLPLANSLLERQIAVAALQHGLNRWPFDVAGQRERAIHGMVHDIDSRFGPQEHILVGHSLGGRDVLAAGEKIAKSHTLKRLVTVAAVGRAEESTVRTMLRGGHKMAAEAWASLSQPFLQKALGDDVAWQMALNGPLFCAEGFLAMSADTHTAYNRLRDFGQKITEIYYKNDAISPPPGDEEIAALRSAGGEVLIIEGTHMSNAYRPDELADEIVRLAA